jgi:hypothetical protein
MSERDWRGPGLLLCCCLLLAACVGLGVPSRITLSEAELQGQLAKRFPLQRSLLETFDLQLAEPRIRLDAQANRLATELQVSGSDRRSGRTLQGRLSLDYGLRYEVGDGSIRLVQPRVQSLEFDAGQGASARRSETTQRMAIALAERLLDDLVLYRVSPERLERLRAAGYRPGALNVTPAGVEITFEPLPPALAPAPPR